MFPLRFQIGMKADKPPSHEDKLKYSVIIKNDKAEKLRKEIHERFSKDAERMLK